MLSEQRMMRRTSSSHGAHQSLGRGFQPVFWPSALFVSLSFVLTNVEHPSHRRMSAQLEPSWLAYISALGTAAAALFAGIAALIAGSQGKSTRELVKLERARDERLREEQRTAQARRVMLDQMRTPPRSTKRPAKSWVQTSSSGSTMAALTRSTR
mgnify:CR=1 FL=1